MTEHIQSYRRNSGLSATLRVLADDLDRISAGRTDADLARAPILFDWETKLNSAHEPAIRDDLTGWAARCAYSRPRSLNIRRKFFLRGFGVGASVVHRPPALAFFIHCLLRRRALRLDRSSRRVAFQSRIGAHCSHDLMPRRCSSRWPSGDAAHVSSSVTQSS